MTPPNVHDAELLAKALGAKGVVIIAFGETGMCSASYGRSKRTASDAGDAMDKVHDLVEKLARKRKAKVPA